MKRSFTAINTIAQTYPGANTGFGPVFSGPLVDVDLPQDIKTAIFDFFLYDKFCLFDYIPNPLLNQTYYSIGVRICDPNSFYFKKFTIFTENQTNTSYEVQKYLNEAFGFRDFILVKKNYVLSGETLMTGDVISVISSEEMTARNWNNLMHALEGNTEQEKNRSRGGNGYDKKHQKNRSFKKDLKVEANKKKNSKGNLHYVRKEVAPKVQDEKDDIIKCDPLNAWNSENKGFIYQKLSCRGYNYSIVRPIEMNSEQRVQYFGFLKELVGRQSDKIDVVSPSDNDADPPLISVQDIPLVKIMEIPEEIPITVTSTKYEPRAYYYEYTDSNDKPIPKEILAKLKSSYGWFAPTMMNKYYFLPAFFLYIFFIFVYIFPFFVCDCSNDNVEFILFALIRQCNGHLSGVYIFWGLVLRFFISTAIIVIIYLFMKFPRWGTDVVRLHCRKTEFIVDALHPLFCNKFNDLVDLRREMDRTFKITQDDYIISYRHIYDTKYVYFSENEYGDKFIYKQEMVSTAVSEGRISLELLTHMFSAKSTANTLSSEAIIERLGNSTSMGPFINYDRGMNLSEDLLNDTSRRACDIIMSFRFLGRSTDIFQEHFRRGDQIRLGLDPLVLPGTSR